MPRAITWYTYTWLKIPRTSPVLAILGWVVVVGFPTERKVNSNASKFRTTPTTCGTTKLTVNLNFLPSTDIGWVRIPPRERGERERERRSARGPTPETETGPTPWEMSIIKHWVCQRAVRALSRPFLLFSLPRVAVIFNEKKLIRDQS